MSHHSRLRQSALSSSSHLLQRHYSTLRIALLGMMYSLMGACASFPRSAAVRTFSTAAAAAASSSSSSPFFTVGITGSSGLVGTALMDELSKRQTVNDKPVRIVRLVRGDAPQQATSLEPKNNNAAAAAAAAAVQSTTTTSLVWNPHGASADDVMDATAVHEMDAIVHLAGENVGTGLGPLGFLGLRAWSASKKQAILDSRVVPTKALAKVVASSSKPMSFLVASGVGAYGDDFIGQAREAVDESASIDSSKGFLANVSRQWEGAAELPTATDTSAAARHRLVKMRFGVVMSKNGGALGKLYPVFWLGGGGRVGSGQQYFSFISARDHARAIVHALETPSLEGPVNFCAPVPCTNLDFTKALGKCISRPTILPFPAFAVNLLFGEMGREMLLGGVRVQPSKLIESGFEFHHPTIEQAIQSAMEESI